MNVLKSNVWLKGLAALIIVMILPLNSIAADVDVYAEGAYTDTDCVVYIYADINSENILSCGVKLSYNPGDLEIQSVPEPDKNPEKNESVWYFGDGNANHAYMEPDTSTAGEIVFILGKLDTAAPTSGVGGARIKLGEVTFSRLNTNTPTVALSIGKLAPFDNFVTVSGAVLDELTDPAGVSFSATVVQRGDADADNFITNSDFFEVRSLMQNNIYHVYADCDGDGYLTNSDFFCIRNNM